MLARAEPLDEAWAGRTSGDVAQRAKERAERAPCQGLGVKSMGDQGPGLVDLLSRHGHGVSRGVEDEAVNILLSAPCSEPPVVDGARSHNRGHCEAKRAFRVRALGFGS